MTEDIKVVSAPMAGIPKGMEKKLVGEFAKNAYVKFNGLGFGLEVSKLA
jgi:hypothetical protein